MTDIVDELRYGHEAATLWHVAREAADTIEALRAENARLQKDLHEYVMQAESGNQKQVAEMCKLRKENARLREALNRLVNEVSGSWGAFEFVLRQELGNTNYACVKDKLEAARTAMGETE